jgi:hypothetical protein
MVDSGRRIDAVIASSTRRFLTKRLLLFSPVIASLFVGLACEEEGSGVTSATTPVRTASETAGRQATATPPFSLIYYDGHIHTTYSDGTGSVKDIKATALRRGLSVVIITDHCAELTRAKWEALVAETAAASDPGTFLALPGFEITGSEGIFNRSHVLAFNVPDPFVGDDANEVCPEEMWPDPPNPAGTGPAYPENLAKWTDYIHSNGGIAVHCHTSGSTRLGYGVDSIEVYNQSNIDDIFRYAKLLTYSDEEALAFAKTLSDLAVYGERDLNTPVPFGDQSIPLRLGVYSATKLLTGVGQWLGSPEAPLNSWDQLLMAYVDGKVDRPIFGVANTDAHNTGDPDSNVGMVKNGLYVKALTAEEVYGAIKAGRGFATTGPSLAFDVNGELIGGTAHIASGGSANLNLRVSSESATGVLVKVDIIKNGELWQTISPMQPVYEDILVDGSVTENGYYRVEVTSRDQPNGPDHFAWSNPVFVSVR